MDWGHPLSASCGCDPSYWPWEVTEELEARMFPFLWNFFQVLCLWCCLCPFAGGPALLIPTAALGAWWGVVSTPRRGLHILTGDLVPSCFTVGKYRRAHGHVPGVLRHPGGPGHRAVWHWCRGALWCWQRWRVLHDLLGPRRADRGHNRAALRVWTGEPGLPGPGCRAWRPPSLALPLATVFSSAFPLGPGRWGRGQSLFL